MWMPVTKRAPVQGDKVLMVLRGVFNHAIDKGWLERNQNPALNPMSKNPKQRQLLTQRCLGCIASVLLGVKTTKPTLLSSCWCREGGLHDLSAGGVSCPMSWDEWDQEQNPAYPCWANEEGQDHLVPLTEPLLEAGAVASDNGDTPFVLSSPGPGRPLISTRIPSISTSYGWDARALRPPMGLGGLPNCWTGCLGIPTEVIQRQIAHAVGNKMASI